MDSGVHGSGPGRSIPLVYVDDVAMPTLAPADERHLRGSLRLEPGASLTVGDGKGKYRLAVLSAENGLEVVGEVETTAPPGSPLTIAFTPIKAAKAEWLITKLTEIGADVIIPLQAERSVVRWDAKKAAKLAERFCVSVREAGMQSRRAHLPVVQAVASTAEVIAQGAVLTEPGGRLPTANDRFLAVGPEGGWSPSELEGADAVVLPGGILRAETAVLVAAGMAAGLGSGILQPTIAHSADGT